MSSRHSRRATGQAGSAPEHAPVRLGGEYTQMVNASFDAIPQHDREARETLRKFLTKKYERDRGSSVARSQNAAFERMKGMAASARPL